MFLKKGYLATQFKLKVQGARGILSIVDNSVNCLSKLFDSSMEDTINDSNVQKQTTTYQGSTRH